MAAIDKKPDLAHRLTDQELAALEKRIAAEYKKAADELTDKIDAYFDSFKKRDAETKALIGTIVNGREYTEKDYQQWRLAQIGRGKRFEALRKRVEEQLAKQRTMAKKSSISDPVVSTSKWQTSKPKRKYKNQPTERLLPNGECIKFGSKTEAAYYDELIFRKELGQVRKIRMQVEYLLKPSYTDGGTGERFSHITYFADFVYEEKREDGSWCEIIIDTKGGGRKGTATKTFVMKRKLMADMGYHVETIERR